MSSELEEPAELVREKLAEGFLDLSVCREVDRLVNMPRRNVGIALTIIEMLPASAWASIYHGL
jgi:hypothetical protein